MKIQKELRQSDFFLREMTFPSIIVDLFLFTIRIAMSIICIRINRDLDFYYNKPQSTAVFANLL